MQTFDDETHLEPLGRSAVLFVAQVAAPWFVNVTLKPLAVAQTQRSSAFIFLRRLAIIGLARDGIDGEALSAYYDAWLQLAAAGVGVVRAMRAPPCGRDEEIPPPNVPIILEFVLHIAGRSEFALELAQQVVLGLFTIAPHTTIEMLLSCISSGKLRQGQHSNGPAKRPSLLESVGSAIADTFRKMSSRGVGPPQLASRDSILHLGEAPLMPPERRRTFSSSVSSAFAANSPGNPFTTTGISDPAVPPGFTKVTVSLRRAPNGGLGLGLSQGLAVR